METSGKPWADLTPPSIPTNRPQFHIRLIKSSPEVRFLYPSHREVSKVGSDSDFSKYSRENLLHQITTFSGRRNWGVEAHCCDYSNLDRLWWYQASDHWNESGPEIRVKVLVEEEGRSKVDYPARDSHAPALEPAHASDKDKHTHTKTQTHTDRDADTQTQASTDTETQVPTHLHWNLEEHNYGVQHEELGKQQWKQGCKQGDDQWPVKESQFHVAHFIDASWIVVLLAGQGGGRGRQSPRVSIRMIILFRL